jgi:hypothetical protein
MAGWHTLEEEIKRAPSLYKTPQFIYSYEFGTDQLHRTDLLTKEDSCHQVQAYQFKYDSCWSELPGGCLLITGGMPGPTNEAVRLDFWSFEVSEEPPMLSPRKGHTVVSHAAHVYVLGGFSSTFMSECERYVCAESRWEALPPLPKACWGMSAVVVEGSLYALGGMDTRSLDLIQTLSLESFTWAIMRLKLPSAATWFPCFQVSASKAFLILDRTLFSFTSQQIEAIKTLSEGIDSMTGPNYYSRGTLFCSYHKGPARRLEIGSLNN